jgi:segregation and condensation protein B
MESRKIPERHVALVEAILFSTSEPLSEEQIAKMANIRLENVREALAVLRVKYQDPRHGIRLMETGGYRLAVKPEFAAKVGRLAKAELSKGLLRVLSIIAYHQPVKQSDIVKIIGNRTYEYAKELEQLGFIKSERKGKTKILSTTPYFEAYFATKKEELKRHFEEAQAEAKKAESREESKEVS